MPLRCEILSTGDEVLTGQLVDTNAAYLAEKMSELGYEVVRHTTVGDERAMLEATFKSVGAEADVVLCTGGLGPTVDDLTSEVAASVLGEELVLHAPSLERIEARWKWRGRQMPENNKKQAYFPASAEVLDNPIGSAPGFALTIGRARFFFMPGVPVEMKKMFAEQVTPRLSALSSEPTVFKVRLYRSFGLTESKADEMLEGIEEAHPGVKLGFRAHFPEIQIKLTVKGDDADAAEALLEAASSEAKRRIGPHIFSEGAPLEEVVGNLLRAQKATLATAESCTGGMVSQMITAIAGSSEYFDRGFVTYTNEAKHDLLGVDNAIFPEHGAVSEPCAKAMAEGARARAGTSHALSITGIAGPGGGTPEKPVGLVYIGLATPTETVVRRIQWTGSRDQVRKLSAMVALDMLRRKLEGHEPTAPEIATRR